jgi:hypothetical protein
MDGAAGRQIALGNSPPLHLPPVKHRRGQLNKRRLDVGNVFAVKDAERDFRRLLALSGDDLHWPTNDALSKKGFVVNKRWVRWLPDKTGRRHCYPHAPLPPHRHSTQSRKSHCVAEGWPHP